MLAPASSSERLTVDNNNNNNNSIYTDTEYSTWLLLHSAQRKSYYETTNIGICRISSSVATAAEEAVVKLLPSITYRTTTTTRAEATQDRGMNL